MAQQLVELTATARPRVGKGAARQARREGKVPAVIYGDNKTPEPIALDYNELWKQVLKGHFTSTVMEIDVGGTKHRVIPRDLQVDPVKDLPVHVDFLRIGKDGVIRVAVPVKFVNEGLSPGLKRGGVLNIVRHEIEVYCPYDRIPAAFEINLEGLQIGRSIHVSFLELPEGVRPAISDRDFTIATIAGAAKHEEEPAAGAEAAPAPLRRGGSGRRGQGRSRSRRGQGCRSGCRQGGGAGRQARRQEVRPESRRAGLSRAGQALADCAMKLFVGLGNPGGAYARHRHNVGFMAVDRIAAQHRFSPWRKRFRGETADGEIAGHRVLLLKPQTYMNESAARRAMPSAS